MSTSIQKPPEILNKIVDLVLAKPKAALKAKEKTANKHKNKRKSGRILSPPQKQ